MNHIIKPILFSTPMVKALDVKEMTRRTQGLEIPNQNPDEYEFLGWNKNIVTFKSPEGKLRDCKPKYNKGDILWVRETLHQNGELGLEYKADSECIDESLIPLNFKVKTDKNGLYSFCDIPNIFMLKCFARFFLEVTNVDCERLHDITEDDAIAEGVHQHSDYGSTGYRHYGRPDEALTDIDAVWSFETLWESINGKDSWKANPWVWVYEFKKIEKPAVWPS